MQFVWQEGLSSRVFPDSYGKHTWEGPSSAFSAAAFPSVWAVRWSSGRVGGLIQVFPLGLLSTSDYRAYFKSMGDLTRY